MGVFGFSSGKTNRFRIVAMVDDDESFSKVLGTFGQKAGFEKVLVFPNATALWQGVQEQKVDVIVMEWKLKGDLSGIALYNRLRRHPDYSLSPIVVQSGFVDCNDFRLVQEFPCTGLLEKPFVYSVFSELIKSLWAESLWYHENIEGLQALLTTIHEKPRETLNELNKLIRKAPNPKPLAVFAGRLLTDKGRTHEAEVLFRRILEVDENNVMAMNELGKLLYRNGKIKEALNTLQLAKHLSPHNMERLCLIGEAELSQHNPEAARAAFSQVLAVDQQDSKARAGLTLADNAAAFFADAHASVSITKNFASLMNTIGITKVRTGAIEEGLAQYQAAMPFINNNLDLAKLMFNMGLGFLRKKDLEQAIEYFQKSIEQGGTDFKKAEEYVRRLKPQIKTATPTVVPAAKPVENADEDVEVMKGVTEIEIPGLGALPMVVSEEPIESSPDPVIEDIPTSASEDEKVS